MPAPASVAVRNLSFSYTSAAQPLFSALTAHFPPGFTGIVGANGAGKTTLLRLICGAMAPTEGVVEGTVEGVEDAVYCPQRTDHPAPGFSDFLQDWSAEASSLRARLNVDWDVDARWSELSHGERKRAQIAHALWHSPALLALDEPTNHIDANARELLLDALQQYRGVGLLVSHDRDLLDSLCQQCIWLEAGHAQMTPGGVSQAMSLRQSARASAQRQRNQLKKQNAQLHREIVRRRESAAAEHKVRSKKHVARKDHDAKEKIDRGRVSDGGAGGQYRQLQGRLSRSEADLSEARVEKEYDTGLWLPGSVSQRNHVLALPEGQVRLDAARQLSWPDLVLRPQDRVAITGVNGAGKSTLVEHMLRRLNVPAAHTVVLRQEISAAEAREVLAAVRARTKAELGHIMTIVRRLNSRPDQLLASQQPSPGEIRKLMLAAGMSQLPHLIIMDEPTNHLDTSSIEALQSALADCPCALLVVSHDQRFIQGIGAVRWMIEVDADGQSALRLED